MPYFFPVRFPRLTGRVAFVPFIPGPAGHLPLPCRCMSSPSVSVSERGTDAGSIPLRYDPHGERHYALVSGEGGGYFLPCFLPRLRPRFRAILCVPFFTAKLPHEDRRT